MTVEQRYERINASDGAGSFDAYCAVPTSGAGPGILLFQEIFGINDNMRGLADRLAGEGYVVLVPDMFWRIEPRFERKDESGMGDAFENIDEVERAVEACPGVEFHRYPAPAGHAFSNWDAPSMYHQPAAEEAWTRTLGFLGRHLR
jgi:dienelactone hydrolase